MSDLGRNNPCSCMSGKKYKNCCINNQSLINKIGYPVIDEAFLLQPLINSSNSFKQFYEAQRNNIPNKIYWCLDKKLQAEMRTTTLIIDNNIVDLVSFKEIPLKTEDAFIVAHEISHHLRVHEGFPSILIKDYSIPNIVNLVGSVANSINDPLANEKLIKYGFDLWSYYDGKSKEQYNILSRFTSEPTSDLAKLYEVSFYCQKTLDWELNCRVKFREKNDFLLWYEQRFPKISNEAKEILSWIKSNGFDTPAKAIEVFTTLLKFYNADKFLIPVTRGELLCAMKQK